MDIDDILSPTPPHLAADLAMVEREARQARAQCDYLTREIDRLESMPPEAFEREQARRHAQALAGDPGPTLSAGDVMPRPVTVRPVNISAGIRRLTSGRPVSITLLRSGTLRPGADGPELVEDTEPQWPVEHFQRYESEEAP